MINVACKMSFTCHGFLLQCSLHFQAKIGFKILHISYALEELGTESLFPKFMLIWVLQYLNLKEVR